MLTALGYGNTELSLALTDDAGIRAVTKQWYGGETVTDVLSFPQDNTPTPREATTGDEQPPHVLGDVVINLDEARRIAPPGEAALRAELDRLLAHGLCHLAGYDHERGEADAQRMRAQERELLRAVEPS